jgi:tRNA (guanosine-2'-O-)-methyltransferase
MEQHLIDYLSQFLTKERYSLFNDVISNRTRYLTVVLEDIYQTQNASAVLRTCECFGFQDVHVIENRNKFMVNVDVVRGATSWLDLHLYNEEQNNTLSAIERLRSDGYRIVATTPHSDDVDLENFDLCGGKAAIFFGTERRGISDVVKANADEFIKIPMHGFTESLNISVSVAVILHHLTRKMRELDLNWRLSDKEQKLLLIRWMKNNVKGGDLIVKKYLETNIM